MVTHRVEPVTGDGVHPISMPVGTCAEADNFRKAVGKKFPCPDGRALGLEAHAGVQALAGWRRDRPRT